MSLPKRKVEEWRDLPERFHPKTAAEACNAVLQNARRMYRAQKAANVQLAGDTPPEFRKPNCGKCKDAGFIRQVSRQTGIAQVVRCPDCLHLVEQRRRQAINRRWPLTSFEEELAGNEWLDYREGAPSAPKARRAQQRIIEVMPSETTLLLYGRPGVGKTRLLVEVVVTARGRGLAAIYRTGKRLQAILQNYPNEGDSAEGKAYKSERLAIARRDLAGADVLAIDEVDDIRGEAFAGDLLDLLNDRIGAGLTTCFAGNDVIDRLPGPIVSRLRARGNIHVDMTGDRDARPYLGHGIQF